MTLSGFSKIHAYKSLVLQAIITIFFCSFSTNVTSGQQQFPEISVDYLKTSNTENPALAATTITPLSVEDESLLENLDSTAVYFDKTDAYDEESMSTGTLLPNEINFEDGSTSSSVEREHPTRPNVILIIADDLGFNDVSFHGSPQIPTPNIDALALSGVILNSYYVSPICTPSRTAIFSGRHPIHTGMQHNVIFGTTPYGFPLKYKILPEYLKDLSYATHLVGKWHMGHYRRQYTPICRGFDSHYGHWTGHKDYYDNMAQESGPQAWGYDMRRNLETTYDNFGKYTTDVYTEEANSIIHNHNKSLPLFLTISHTAVHSANPYHLLQAPKENVDSFAGSIKDIKRRTFAGMVQKLDDSVGEVVKTLFEERMLDNSIIIFTTDNGGPAAGFNGNAASNWPLRGVKNTLWEGGVRGAALIWSPMITQTARGVSTQLIHIQDWLPTILKAVGVENPGSLTGDIDGIDMWDTIRLGLKSPRTELLHNIDDRYGNEAVRSGTWKLLHGTTYNGQWDGWYGPSGRKKPHKQVPAQKLYNRARSSIVGRAVLDLKMFPNDLRKVSDMLEMSQIQCNDTMELRRRKASCSLVSGEYCLYNIVEDPCEQNNLAKELPEKVDELKKLLQKFRESAVPPINKPKDPEGLPINWNYTWTNWVDFVQKTEYKTLCE